MSGAVLNACNVRLDATTLRYIFEHGESKIVFVDSEYASVVKSAVTGIKNPPLLVDIIDPAVPGERIGTCNYEEFMAQAENKKLFIMPKDEWTPITLNYTSGTTGNPKGVVYHHRGAYLMAMGTAVSWNVPAHNRYLCTVPMFHCNGWCHPWMQAILAGVSICMRKIDGADILRLIAKHEVQLMGGAPIVLNTIVNAAAGQPLPHKVQFISAAAPPPASVLQAAQALGFNVMHVYGLTETYGHTTMCAWKNDLWDTLPQEEQEKKMIRQGVGLPILEDWAVFDNNRNPVAQDGKTIGEIVMRGNVLMSGYLKNTSATNEVFAGGWFKTGDLGVWHEDDYLQVKDRLKDIIISGGENISSIAVENALCKHSAVAMAAVVAKPDEKWGETPCAFVEIKLDEATPTVDDIKAFCKQQLPSYMCPQHVIFFELPKTATGKIKKFELREQAKTL
jgi:fatty-acyl-CoA synthase